MWTPPEKRNRSLMTFRYNFQMFLFRLRSFAPVPNTYFVRLEYVSYYVISTSFITSHLRQNYSAATVKGGRVVNGHFLSKKLLFYFNSILLQMECVLANLDFQYPKLTVSPNHGGLILYIFMKLKFFKALFHFVSRCGPFYVYKSQLMFITPMYISCMSHDVSRNLYVLLKSQLMFITPFTFDVCLTMSHAIFMSYWSYN